MVKSCWICKTSGNKLNKSYFRIPKILFHRNHEIAELSALRMEKWRDALLLPDDTSGIRICSDHFLSGTPARLLDIHDQDWVPTKNLKPNVNLLENLKDSTRLRKTERTVQVSCRFCCKLVSKELSINIFKDLNKKILEMAGTVLGHKIVFEEGDTPYACSPCLKKLRVCARLLAYFRTNEKHFIESKSETAKAVERKDLRRKNEEADKVSQTTSTVSEQKNNDVLPITETITPSEENRIDSLYNSEQIRSIIEDNSPSSEDDATESGNTTIKCKRRKYDVQSVNVRPIELKTLKCNNCFKKFADVDGLTTHKNFCKLFYCQLCKPQIIFRNKDDLEKHKKTYHCQSLVCHICGKNYSQSYLVKHFKNHFEDRKKCPFCDRTLKNVTILMAHVDHVHGNRFSSVCEVCGGKFKNLKKHLTLCSKSGS